MKLYVDPPNARLSTVGDFFQLPHMQDQRVWLTLPVVLQERSRWCWASIAQSLRGYYYGEYLSQRDVAEQILGYPAGSIAPQESTEVAQDSVNVNFKLDEALARVGCFGNWSPGKPRFERLWFEINQGRPVAARIEWHGGDAHYVLINGYTAGGGEVMILDPLHGPGLMDYSKFPRHYDDRRGTWTETFWTNKNNQ